MDVIRVPKVDGVILERNGVKTEGILHLTLHHMIFAAEGEEEIWTAYPLINLVTRLPQTFNGLSPLCIRTRTFETFSLSFSVDQHCGDVFETVKDLTVAPSIEKLYAFSYAPSPPLDASGGWTVYTPREEFARQGVGSRTKAWRFTDLNKDYSYSSTYPSKLVVPAKISDSVLNHAARYRSKERIPALTYLHWANHASITRSSQPMVGLKNSRSVQDEKLIESIFQTHLAPTTSYAPTLDSPRPTHHPNVYGATCTNLIIDARPTTNAMANVAKGAGTENMEHYKGGKKAYLGIENIHVMRDSLSRVVEALRDSEVVGGNGGPGSSSSGVATLPLDRQALRRSGWLKHTTSILEGSNIIVRNIHVNSSHVLIHCSDGWDRTAQLSAVAQLCLDPFYRTIKGFQILIEKDWLSFGHKFQDRCGHLSSDKFFTQVDSATGESSSSSSSSTGAAQAFFASVQKQFVGNSHLKETSPVFHQFLDCVRQIQRQFPDRFEFNELFLRTLHTHLYSCQFGTFIFNSERDRRIPEMGPRQAKLPFERTVSVWDWIDSEGQRERWKNATYDTSLDDRTSRESGADMGVLFPNPKDVRFWSELFRRGDEEMNGKVVVAVQEELPSPPDSGEEDPVVAAVVEESEAIDSGRSTPILPPSATSLGEAAAIPYHALSRKSPSPSNSLLTSSASQPINPAHRALEPQDTFRPYSSRTSAFSLQPTPGDEDSVASPPSSQSSFPATRFTSSPSTINSSSSRAGTSSSQSDLGGGSSSTSSWGWAFSGAASVLAGAAKEISRVAATTSGGSSSGGSSRSRKDQPLDESWSSSSRGPGGTGGGGGGGGARPPLGKGITESNPWAQDEPDQQLPPPNAKSIPTSRGTPEEEGTPSSWTVIPQTSFGGRNNSQLGSSYSTSGGSSQLASSSIPSPSLPRPNPSSSPPIPTRASRLDSNPLGGTAEDWSTPSPFPPPSTSSARPNPPSSLSRASTRPDPKPNASASSHNSLSELTLDSISLPSPLLHSSSKPTFIPSASSLRSAPGLSSLSLGGGRDTSPSPSARSVGKIIHEKKQDNVEGGGFDPLGVGLL
ncbi:protein-tyrosine phosphatase-like protein [Mrakia frigida]|uniref:phosphatidylinositol-3-phosphatase YMR1 n=1 Tax=Mrakia frigida TaxID=29902 RepID=UPI003FCC269A